MATKDSLCEFEAHPWRNRCIKCKEPKSDHKLSENDIQKLQGILDSLERTSTTMGLKSDGMYNWLPPECPRDRIADFFSCFPEDMIPRHRSQGITNRIGQIFKQIPLSDISESDGKFVDKVCVVKRNSHITNILNKKIKLGLVKEWKQDMHPQCPKCLDLLKENELVVISNDIPFHPACFTCCVCKESLADLIHCAEFNGDVYCIRHYSENYQKRCYACDELIFTTRLTQWKNTFYHPDHLRCFECEKKMESGSTFESEGQMYCAECYQKMIPAKCEMCGKKVCLGLPHVMLEEKCWHPECFKCNQCGDVLEKFKKHKDKFLCRKCYKVISVPKCVECGIPFVEDATVIKYEGKMYHIPCFRCEDCQDSFNAGPFVPHGDLVYCKVCYMRNFGTRCFKCQYAITDEPGLMYKNKPYHSACFICCNCSEELGKNPFKLVGEKTYCLRCYGENFCKRCHSCEKPIVLRGEDVLYSYEESHWHSSCLVCQSCGNSVANLPFHLQGTTIVCTDCTEKAVEEAKKREEEQALEEALVPEEGEEVPQEEGEEATPETEDQKEMVEQEAVEKEVEKKAGKKKK